MENNEYILDEEAADLFKKLQGIDTGFGKDRLNENLKKIKKRDDQRRSLLVELTHRLGAYLTDVNLYQDSMIEEETIRQIAETLDHLVKISPQDKILVIKSAGFSVPGVLKTFTLSSATSFWSQRSRINKCRIFPRPLLLVKLLAALLSVPKCTTLDRPLNPISQAKVKSPFARVTASTIP